MRNSKMPDTNEHKKQLSPNHGRYERVCLAPSFSSQCLSDETDVCSFWRHISTYFVGRRSVRLPAVGSPIRSIRDVIMMCTCVCERMPMEIAIVPPSVAPHDMKYVMRYGQQRAGGQCGYVCVRCCIDAHVSDEMGFLYHDPMSKAVIWNIGHA